MSEHERLLAALKAALKSRGWRYVDLAQALKTSEPTIKRMFSTGRIDLARLGQVCEALGIDFFELARAARGARDTRHYLATKQEAALARSPRLMTVFHLLCQGWRTDAIGADYGVPPTELTRLLARLDRLALIELLPGNRVRMRVPRDFSWRDGGPVRVRYMQMASQEFLRDAFSATDASMMLELGELTDASAVLLRQKLARVVVEFKEAAEMDIDTVPAQRRSMGMLVAIRPWVFSISDSLRDAQSGTTREWPAR